ncbi:MAG: 16S rRNA (adenine(1518)-N(6)/adenine(1519)-N(6))-dimethyltransferase RsmA [Alphaproteobacteria bacterium]|nr:16S rRNA (adenine(1518)-N(6)/adenine(1519)-N(6))-dimethyltransferase RsmA [Alphaproteobacteria bacterium]
MSPLPPLRDQLARHGIVADKRLGQHFLLDLNLTARIARAAGDVTRGTTIEIGPGPGGLTRALLDQNAHVMAVERDHRLQPLLDEVAAHYAGHLTLIWADALKTDLSAIGPKPRRIVANLPYNIATELIMRWLDQINAFESLTLMVQSEVADRFVAKPNSADYGRLSVRTQWLCEVERLFTVNPRSFVPPPKVESAVIRLIPRPSPPADADDETLQRVTAAAFGQRRKMLRQSLNRLAREAGFADGSVLCTETGIEPTARAETLSVEQFCRIARAVGVSRRAASR